MSDDNDLSPADLAESIIDQEWINAGMTPEQVRQAKILASIEVRLSAEGHSVEEFYAEFAKSTPEDIIEKYAYKLTESQKVPSISSETGELNVSFIRLEMGPFFSVAYFQVNMGRNEGLYLTENIIQLRVKNDLINRVSVLKEGQPVSIRMHVAQSDQGTDISLSSIKPDKSFHPTFPNSFHR